MSSSDEGGSSSSTTTASHHHHQHQQRKLKGIRRRKWGKWVSEIRVPGSQDRLWLGTYSTPEAAAVAHDIAKYCLRENATSREDFNFPLMIPAGVHKGMSPRSVQRVAGDAGLAVDAQYLSNNDRSSPSASGYNYNVSGNAVRWDQNHGNYVNDGRNWQCDGDDNMNDDGSSVAVSSSSDTAKPELDISVDDYL